MRKDQKHFSYVILEFLPLCYTLNKNAFFFRLSDSNQNQLRKLQCLYVDLEYIILRAIRGRQQVKCPWEVSSLLQR